MTSVNESKLEKKKSRDGTRTRGVAKESEERRERRGIRLTIREEIEKMSEESEECCDTCGEYISIRMWCVYSTLISLFWYQLFVRENSVYKREY